MELSIIQYMAQGQSVHWWFQARSQIIGTMIFHNFGAKKLRILEIGAGTGACISILKQYGTVTVMEPDPICRLHLQKQFGLNAIIGSIPDSIPTNIGQFDLICMFDVLEHIDGDEEALKSLHKLLAPEGRIFITVPAYQWLWSSLDTLSHHKRRYNAKHLRKVVFKSDLLISKLTYFNCILFPLAALIRLYDKSLNIKSSTGYDVPNKYINWVLKKVLCFEKIYCLLLTYHLDYHYLRLCTLERAVPEAKQTHKRTFFTYKWHKSARSVKCSK